GCSSCCSCRSLLTYILVDTKLAIANTKERRHAARPCRPWHLRSERRPRGRYSPHARQRAAADAALQIGGMGRSERGFAGRGGGAVAVGHLAAPRQDARGGHRHLPARRADALVPGRRAAHRASARLSAEALLQRKLNRFFPA